jgi:hypothetical protein
MKKTDLDLFPRRVGIQKKRRRHTTAITAVYTIEISWRVNVSFVGAIVGANVGHLVGF